VLLLIPIVNFYLYLSKYIYDAVLKSWNACSKNSAADSRHTQQMVSLPF
jgi:hypothetical protein